MDLEEQLQEEIGKAINELFEASLDIQEVKLQPTRKEFPGTYTFVTFPYLKVSRKSPEETGKMVGDYLIEHSLGVKAYNVVKGFLNLEISDKTWIETFKKIHDDRDYGFNPPSGHEAVVEYSSPNTNKPLHLGHLRNILLGSSVAQILKANGQQVHRVQIINDRGIHICKSMLAWQRWGNGETPETAGMKGDKLVGKYYVKFETEYRQQVQELVEKGLKQVEAEKKAPLIQEAQELLRRWEEKNPEVYQLWQKLNGWVYSGFDKTYHEIGVGFDQLYYESDTYLLGKDEVKKGLEKEVFYQKDDGSVWVDLTREGLDEKILLRADGTSVYITQDIGTAILRFKDFPKMERCIYVVGNEQEYHFKVLFLILQELGLKWAENCYHLSYGMVDLPSGKMKSREGTVVDADDLVAEMIKTAGAHTKELGKIEGFSKEQAQDLYRMLGLGALKYFLLKVDPQKRMLFDPEESIQFHGNTGPFIQYTHARISAILRRAQEDGIEPTNDSIDSLDQLQESEREVIYILSLFKNRVKEAAKEYSPAIIAQYVYELAKEYNRFYTEVPIFGEADQKLVKFRVAFSRVVAQTIKKAMGLLNIEVPERM